MDENRSTTYQTISHMIRLEDYPKSPPALFDLLNMIIQWVTEMLRVKACEIFLWDPVKEELVLSVSNGFLTPYVGTRLKPGEGISGRTFLSNEPIIVENYDKWEGKPPAFYNHPVDTDVLAMPMRWQDRIIGVLVVDTDIKVKKFDENDVRIVNMFANVASAAIMYERFFRMLEKRTNRVNGLTNREKEIISLILDGKSNPEIAECLVVSRSTIKVHVSHILEKLGLENRMELIKYYSDLFTDGLL